MVLCLSPEPIDRALPLPLVGHREVHRRFLPAGLELHRPKFAVLGAPALMAVKSVARFSECLIPSSAPEPVPKRVRVEDGPSSTRACHLDGVLPGGGLEQHSRDTQAIRIAHRISRALAASSVRRRRQGRRSCKVRRPARPIVSAAGTRDYRGRAFRVPLPLHRGFPLSVPSSGPLGCFAHIDSLCEHIENMLGARYRFDSEECHGTAARHICAR